MILLIVLLIVLIVFILILTNLYNNISKSPTAYAAKYAMEALQEISKDEQEKEQYLEKERERIQEISKYDMNFSKDYLVDLIRRAFPLTLQLENNDSVSKLEPYVTPSYLHDFVSELQRMSHVQKRKNRNIKIKDVYITDFIPSKEVLTIHVNLLVEFDKTYYGNNNAISKLNHIRTIYKVELQKMEEITQYDEKAPITNCPNCGSPVNVLLQTHCEYCGTEIYKKTNLWLIHKISATEQKESLHAKV